MTRSSRSALVLTIALVMAAVASFGVYRVISNLSGRDDVAVVQSVVASRPIPLGTRLTTDHVKLVSWPADSPVPGAFASVEEVLNRGVITAVTENEPLTESKLAPLESGAGLPPSIPEGMRAISVKVNEVVGVAGFVVPGTRVDVMVTLSGGRSQQDDSLSRIVVSNVQVLTAGTRYDQEKAKEGDPIPSTVVTLLVSPADGERVALAATEGQIMLTLRNPMDVKPSETTGVRTSALFGQATPVPPPAAGVRRSRTPVVTLATTAPVVITRYTVETIRAAKRTEEVVR
jgi:pilus assembly protein CpaB